MNIQSIIDKSTEFLKLVSENCMNVDCKVYKCVVTTNSLGVQERTHTYDRTIKCNYVILDVNVNGSNNLTFDINMLKNNLKVFVKKTEVIDENDLLEINDMKYFVLGKVQYNNRVHNILNVVGKHI